jgi:hypothetical protein
MPWGSVKILEIDMKRVLAVAVLALATLPVMAQHHHGHGHGHWNRGYGGGWHWVVPAIIGGAVVYGATRPDPVIIQQPPVIVQQQPVPYYGQSQNCSPWTETQNSDGTITRTRTCAQ